jgi:hypothetical protein
MAAMIYALSGCERRPLEGNFDPETALIPVHIDWSKSGVPVEQMHRASILLFPEAGGEPLEYRMEKSLTDDEIQVPVGVYSVIVFNETTDPTDWEFIDFTDKDSYHAFAAVALPAASRGFYSRADDIPLIENPDPLAAWSLTRFEVTKEIMLRSRSTRGTRANSRAEEILDEQIAGLSNIVPTPRIETITITARVTNLASSMQVTGILDGMSTGVYMASGEKMTTTGAHAFILNGRVYDENGKDGTTTKTFNIFGRKPPTAHIDLYIDFLLNDGTLHPRQSFDATNMTTSIPDTAPPADKIEVGYSDLPPDHPIVLPDMDVNAGIDVDDWDDVIVPLL